MAKHKVLFVCLGNICRSPSAEGVFQKGVTDAGLSAQFEVDSAGTGSWHIGNPPDKRAQAAALARGIDLSGLRARQVRFDDFAHFDYIIAMDRSNLANLKQQSHRQYAGKIRLFLEFAWGTDLSEVPDPYYGGEKGFDFALDLIEDASQGLLQHILER